MQLGCRANSTVTKVGWAIHLSSSAWELVAGWIGLLRSQNNPRRVSGWADCSSYCFVTTILTLLAAVNAADAETVQEFFRSKVEPILKQNCYECHSHATGKAKGGLVLDSKSGWNVGGDSGPALVPGKPDESRLLVAIGYDDDDLQMPPSGKLSKTDIAVLRKWIVDGAVDPRVSEAPTGKTIPLAGKDYWSFHPRTNPILPAGNGTPIDRFVNRRLRDANLEAVARSAPQKLLRRVTFDLTGLPPSRATMEQFDVDGSPMAFEHAVDRLLSSPAFGEHWARHWLDLTAYADTIGTGRALPATNAWRFRDYIINSFNADKPFNTFIREQIAGDLIKTESIAERRANLTATGFLALGPWPLENGDKPQLRMDVVDFQIKRVGKVFLGMTFGCARCHDHKFDPVSQKDYYALAGFFRSTMTLKGRLEGIYSDVYRAALPEHPDEMIRRANELRLWERKLPGLESFRDKAKTRVEGLERIEKRLKESKKKLSKRFEAQLKAAKMELAEAEQKLDAAKYNRPFAPVVNAVTDFPEPEDCRINIRGNARALGDEVPRGYVEVINWSKKEPQFAAGQSGRMELAEWVAHPKNPLTARVFVNRVWHHLFGQGLVASPDNFGLRGSKPTHPDLLDYLAGRFVDGGWSIKSLIREIVLSETYQRSSADNPEARAIDPDNRLLWRSNRRRLQAEQIRDAVMMAAGELDRAGGGPSLPSVFSQNLALAPPVAIYDGVTHFEHIPPRRSIYQPIKRKSAFSGLGILDAFDFPSTNEETGKRSVTTVANQALFMMNSKFAKEKSMAAAKDVTRQSKKFREQLNELYLRTLSRPPFKAEVKRVRSFVARYQSVVEGGGMSKKEKRIEALSKFAQALFASNEFLFRQ
ncbi:MAG: hypothetical protein CMO80_09610 [Verrucomicrobiales bacterium]|nr:hypothetical protein [Verrucomicrobiales bacterium]